MLGRMAGVYGMAETNDDRAVLRWNAMPPAQAERLMLAFCGSRAWAREMAARRPVPDRAALLRTAGEVWDKLEQADWREAFAAHPRIGERPTGMAPATVWSRAEQAGVPGEARLANRLHQANARYEARFGRVFLIRALGRDGQEILREMERRMENDDSTEMREAAREQREITALRLERCLAEGEI